MNAQTSHQIHMNSHESRFGKLGELQTKDQKRALKEANTKLENELTPEQKASVNDALQKATKS